MRVNEHFETIFNAAITEKMHCAKLIIYFVNIKAVSTKSKNSIANEL